MPSPSKKVFYGDYVLHIYENVYEPADDSFLFAENLTEKKGDIVLDMGTGCGILALAVADEAAKVVAVDINPYAIRCAKRNAKLNRVAHKIFFVQGNLFAPLGIEEKFDLILFNAPYLPSKPLEDNSWLELAWAGGVTGRRVIDRFICEAPKYMKPDGRILLMQSTRSDISPTLRTFEKKELDTKIIATRAFPFFEEVVLIQVKAA